MATNSISVFNFFTSSNLKGLNIPLYQRPYSWRMEHLEEFFNDIKLLLTNPNSKHFLGLIVLVKDNKDGFYEVIDGQQRLTTFSITLAIIRDYLDDLKENNFNILDKTQKTKIDRTCQQIEQCLIHTNSKGERELKLTTSSGKEYESKILENILVSISDLTKTDYRFIKYTSQTANEKDTYQVKSTYMSDKNVFIQRTAKTHRGYKNFSIIKDILDSQIFIGGQSTIDNRINFICNILTPSILERIHIVDFVSDNHSDAFSTFEVLNNRGLVISSTDLIKNICLKKASSSQIQDQIFNDWNKIFNDTLNNQDDIQFLRYSNNSRRKFITKSELYNQFELIINDFNETQLLSFLNNELLNDAIIYEQLKDKNSVFTEALLHNVVKLLQSTKSNQWFSIAISAIRAYNQHNSILVLEQLHKLFETVHEVIFCMILKDKKANLVEQRFPEVARRISGYSNTKELIKIYQKENENLKKFRDNEGLNYPNIDLADVDYSSNNLNGAMILSFIEYKTSQGNINLRSLEHILPQNPNGKNWPIIKGINPILLETSIFSLGNMLLIEKPLNSKVKASPFENKVLAYNDHKIIDPLYIDPNNINNIKKINKFDLNTISERTKKIIEKYKDLVN
jgi:uncharacterized protein with ParB-like and HNH nuclease domain